MPDAVNCNTRSARAAAAAEWVTSQHAAPQPHLHRSLVVRASAITTAQRDESGRVFLQLRDRPERLTASRLYAHLFKGL